MPACRACWGALSAALRKAAGWTQAISRASYLPGGGLPGKTCVPGAAGLQRALGRVPSAVFAQSAPGAPRYRPLDRAACVGVKFLEYSLAGMVCGFVGQGFANGLMTLKCASVLPVTVQLCGLPCGRLLSCLACFKSGWVMATGWRTSNCAFILPTLIQFGAVSSSLAWPGSGPNRPCNWAHETSSAAPCCPEDNHV